jgi:hypothetical protein
MSNNNNTAIRMKWADVRKQIITKAENIIVRNVLAAEFSLATLCLSPVLYPVMVRCGTSETTALDVALGTALASGIAAMVTGLRASFYGERLTDHYDREEANSRASRGKRSNGHALIRRDP